MSINSLFYKLQSLNEAKEKNSDPFKDDPTNSETPEDTGAVDGEGDKDGEDSGGEKNDDNTDDAFKDDPTSDDNADSGNDDEPNDDKAEGVPDLEDPGDDDVSDPTDGNGDDEDTDIPDEGADGDGESETEINILNLSPISKAILNERLIIQYNELLDKINTVFNKISKLSVEDIEQKNLLKEEIGKLYDDLNTYINHRILGNSYDRNFLNFSVFLNKFNEILGNIDSMYEQTNKIDDSKEKNL